jgi:hypothetical protein
VIDCNEKTMDTAAAFWGGVLGMSRDPADEGDASADRARLLRRPSAAPDFPGDANVWDD